MKATKLTVLFTAAALLFSGCSQNSAPAAGTTTTAAAVTAASETTTAGETSTASETAASETTTAAALNEEVPETTTETAPEEAAVSDENADDYDSDLEKHPFRLGVWLVKNEEGSEYYDETYYCFREGGCGSTLSQNMGIGVPFGYERVEGSKTKFRFEIAAAENYSYMEMIDADIDEDHFKVTWDSGEDVQDWSYLCPTEEFSFYSNYSIGLMAEKLFGMSLESVENEIAETGYELGMISVVIRDPSVEDYTKSILKWYNIDRYTAKGHDVMTGDTVDLTVLEDGWDEMPYPDYFNPLPTIKEFDTLRERGEMLGFRYIGYVEPDMDDLDNFRDFYAQIFKRTGMDTKVRYVNRIPSADFVTSGGGQELYLLLPSDIHGSITISELVYDEEAEEMKESRVLYEQDGDLRPILLKCNRSEIMPDVVIKLTEDGGRKYVEWSPYVSGENGTVPTDNEFGAAIHDFTDYDSLTHPDNMPEAMG
ncbi:MAG: hypothetical protein IJT87_09145 [Ruminiclostridium sp.]|nr:hypothetical protein [Ruminiclostridium sp.]